MDVHCCINGDYTHTICKWQPTNAAPLTNDGACEMQYNNTACIKADGYPEHGYEQKYKDLVKLLIYIWTTRCSNDLGCIPNYNKHMIHMIQVVDLCMVNSWAPGICGYCKSIKFELIVQKSSLGTCNESALWCMLENLTNDKSTRVQVMA